jgi:serine/threonine protein phosphatase PrpC
MPPAGFPPSEALHQTIGLGQELAALHRQGIAHLHVHPENLTWAEGRLVLGCMATAHILPPDSPDAPFLFARDANFLALTLGALTSSAANAPAADAQLQAAISAIREQGARQAYESIEQVLAECQGALALVGDADGAAAPTARASALPAAPLLPWLRPAPAWTISIGQASSVGLVRPHNEDALGQLHLTLRAGHGQPLLLTCGVVADGVGGEAHGELASHLAVSTILERITRQLALPALAAPMEQAASAAPISPMLASADAAPQTTHLLQDALLDGFRAANRAILALERAPGQLIATTATAVLLVGDQAMLAHVGDSRAYRLHQGTLTALTSDHSVIGRLVQMGQLDPAQAASHPQRATLYRALGQHEQVEVELLACPLAAGDRLLLCSDGLWGALPPEQLAACLAESPPIPAPALAAHLVALADAAGGEDNSTALILDILPDSLPEPAPAAEQGK